MGGRLDPRVAAVRTAVRADLRALITGLHGSAASVAAPGDELTGRTVLVACSGGADSTALAAAVAFEAPRLGLRAGAVTVDHGLQAGSAARARSLVARLQALGLEPVNVVTVEVPRGTTGPEAAARTARYRSLDDVADTVGAVAILLGHTSDDQAETVLLGLARGSGARSLAGMRGVSGRYRRPLLGLGRDATAGACAAQQLPVWVDPHNTDPRFTRARVRHGVLPVLERELGPGVAAALARTAEQLRADADVLDAMAGAELTRLTADNPDGALPVDELTALSAAVGSRVVRTWLIAAGVPANDLTYRHVVGVLELVTAWRGQRWVGVPGGRRVSRRDDRLAVAPEPAVGG